MTTIRGVKDRRFKFVQLLNSMFEDPKLSLKAKGFIGYCLTKTETWHFNVAHLQKVLLEGERAIYSTINECIEHGYAFRYETRKPNGDFGEWETVFSDSKEEIVLLKQELIEKGIFKESFTNQRFADPIVADPQDVPTSNTECSSNTDCEKQQQQQPPVVVVFSESKSLELLKAQGFDDKTAKSLSRFSLEIIEFQIQHLKTAQDLLGVDNPLGWLRNAIENNWKPAEIPIDPTIEAAQIREKSVLERQKVRAECEKLYDVHEKGFTTRKYFDIGIDVISMRSGDKQFCVPYDNRAVKTLKRFIEIEGL